jgi:hypothetical protein
LVKILVETFRPKGKALDLYVVPSSEKARNLCPLGESEYGNKPILGQWTRSMTLLEKIA